MSSLKTPNSIGGKSAITISHSRAILDKVAPQVCNAWNLLLGEFGGLCNVHIVFDVEGDTYLV